jgi:adenine-specific DNA glycosylase
VDLNSLSTEESKEGATRAEYVPIEWPNPDYVTAVISHPSDVGPKYFLVQRPETGLLAGLWDFPNIALEASEIDDAAESALLEYLASLGLATHQELRKIGSSLHIFTHIRRTSLVYTVQVGSEIPGLQGKWVTEEEIAEMALSELGRKVLRLALGIEKKRKSPAEKVEAKSKKVVKMEKGQTKLTFAVSQKTTVAS